MQFSVYTYEVKMSRWLKNNTLNCKWTLQIRFGKDSTRFNQTVCLQYAWVSNQRSFRKITSKARPTPCMQIPWGGINPIEWKIFSQKKKKCQSMWKCYQSASWGATCEKAHIQRKGEGQRGHYTQVPSAISTQAQHHLWHHLLQLEEWHTKVKFCQVIGLALMFTIHDHLLTSTSFGMGFEA